MFSPFTWRTAVSVVACAAAFLLLPIVASPLVFLGSFGGKIGTKGFGLAPVLGAFRRDRNERWYYTLMMSTGLTFGTISALFGLTHGIVSQEQYSHLVAVVIASAVIPTLVAGRWFMPSHLLTPAFEAGMTADAAVVEARRGVDPVEPLEEG